MSESIWRRLVDELIAAGVDFDPGLTDAEVIRAESTFRFRFPPDLREFLETALPRGDSFPDWRRGNESRCRDWLRWPLEGILFDIEHNDFWLPDWGPPPATLEERRRVATGFVAAAPKLIPVFSHRMMPNAPHAAGNPVFSVHQTDIIYYGFDLADYFRHEFNLPGREPWPESIRSIPFWDVDRFQATRKSTPQ